MPLTSGEKSPPSPKKSTQKRPLFPKIRAKYPTFSQKARKKVHFIRESTPPNPDLATGLKDVWENVKGLNIFAAKFISHELDETCHSVTFIVLVNSHQR